jgi:hypothetical protein
MYRFLTILPDGTALSVAIAARDVHQAFRVYRRQWWTPQTEDVAVYRDSRLVARASPAFDMETGATVPILRQWK